MDIRRNRSNIARRDSDGQAIGNSEHVAEAS
jgi:hypothetical protein